MSIEPLISRFLNRKSYARDNFWLGTKASHISITAISGAGKSALMDKLVNPLPTYTVVDASKIMEELRVKHGFDPNDKLGFAQFNRDNPELDLDRACEAEMLRTVLSTEECISISRLGHLFPGFHVLLTCRRSVRATRRWEQLKKHKNISVGGVYKELLDRDTVDAARYDKLYPDWNWPENDYDLVLCTEQMSVEEECQRILSAYARWLSGTVQPATYRQTTPSLLGESLREIARP